MHIAPGRLLGGAVRVSVRFGGRGRLSIGRSADRAGGAGGLCREALERSDEAAESGSSLGP